MCALRNRRIFFPGEDLAWPSGLKNERGRHCSTTRVRNDHRVLDGIPVGEADFVIAIAISRPDPFNSHGYSSGCLRKGYTTQHHQGQ